MVLTKQRTNKKTVPKEPQVAIIEYKPQFYSTLYVLLTTKDCIRNKVIINIII